MLRRLAYGSTMARASRQLATKVSYGSEVASSPDAALISVSRQGPDDLISTAVERRSSGP